MNVLLEKLYLTIISLLEKIRVFFKKFASSQRNYEDEYNTGVDLYEKGLFIESIEYYKKALRLNPDKAAVYYNLGLAYFSIENFNEAEINFRRAISIDANDVDAYYNLGLLLHKKGDLEEALRQFQGVINLNKEDPDNFYAAATVFADMKRFDEAITYIKKAIELSHPNFDYVFALATISDRKSEISANTEDINHAIKAYEEVLKMDSVNEDINYRLAICYARKGMWDQCVNYCKKVIDINPDSALAYNQFGLALFCKEDLDNAIIMYRKAIVIHPDLLSVYFNLGSAYEKQGDFKAAVESYKKYMKMADGQPETANLPEHIKELEECIKLKS